MCAVESDVKTFSYMNAGCQEIYKLQVKLVQHGFPWLLSANIHTDTDTSDELIFTSMSVFTSLIATMSFWTFISLKNCLFALFKY